MNRPEQFRKSIDTLATAYFEGTLAAGSCRSCAVGNLIRSEGRYISDDGLGKNWFSRLNCFRSSLRDLDKPITDALPYTAEEIDHIERAFEHSVQGWKDDPYFPALMSVVDVLFDIHDVTDEDLRRDAKAAFDGDYETVDAVL